MRSRPLLLVLALGLVLLLAPRSAFAKPKSPAPPPAASTAASSSSDEPSSSNDESTAAAQPAPLHWTVGPSPLELGHALTLRLPEGDLFLGGAEAKTLLEKNGTFQNDNLLGIVVPSDEKDWLVTIRYEEDGYVKDDEKLDADEVLKALREGTEEGNKERVAHGFEPLSVGGWRETPRYERALHHLVWGLDVSSPKNGVSVNYSTRVLGRHGWVALNLLSPPEHLEVNKPGVALLLAATSFDPGSRYEDYVAGKDKVAEYGLVGLVLGGVGLTAVKLAKVGIIAKFWNVILAGLLAFKKAIVLAIAAGVGFFRKLFGRKRTTTPEVGGSS